MTSHNRLLASDLWEGYLSYANGHCVFNTPQFSAATVALMNSVICKLFLKVDSDWRLPARLQAAIEHTGTRAGKALHALLVAGGFPVVCVVLVCIWVNFRVCSALCCFLFACGVV